MNIDKSLTPKQSQCRLNLAFGSLILGGVIVVIVILAVCGVFNSKTRTNKDPAEGLPDFPDPTQFQKTGQNVNQSIATGKIININRVKVTQQDGKSNQGWQNDFWFKRYMEAVKKEDNGKKFTVLEWLSIIIGSVITLMFLTAIGTCLCLAKKEVKKIESVVNEQKQIEKEQFKMWQIEEEAKRNQEQRNQNMCNQQRQAPRQEIQLYPRLQPNINEIIEEQVDKRFQKLIDTQQQIENHIRIQNIDVDTSPRKDNN